MLRSLLALSVAVGVGLVPSVAPVPDAAPPAPAAPAAATPAAPAGGAVDVSVEEVALEVVPAAEAAPAVDGTARAADPGAAGSPEPTTTPTGPEPTAEPTPTASPEPARTASPGPAPDPAGSVAPADGVVTADVLADDRVVTPAVEAAEVQTVGITWPEGADAAALDPRLRFREGDAWSAWVDLGVSDAEPDAGTADAEHALRGGTDSYWIGEADAVQLSFAATAEGGPDDLQLALIASDEQAAVVEGAASSSDVVVRTAAWTGTTAAVLPAATQPGIVTRAQWGARGPSCTPDVAGRLEGAVVHHTAGSNAYTTQAQAMQQIRNDQAYHINTRGWCDIGYNFVVDKWGNIYEGRANSLTQAVIGVHASGANTGTVGVSMLGNYDTVPTTPAMIDAVGRIIGWRLGVYGINPHGTGTYPSGLVLPRIIGHRDVTSTACPGRYGYAQMGNIRNIAAANLGSPGMPRATAQAVVRALYADLLGRGADATGLRTWTDALAGGTSQSELVATLTRSDEYINIRVRQAYREVLGRDPEPAGAASWLTSIRAAGGSTVDDVQRRFYDSEEYYVISGSNGTGYVQRLYRTMLGREASQADLAAWVPRMGTSAGRAQVVHGIWFSVEAAQRRAGAYYQVFLRRGPDGPGLANWANVLLTYGEGSVRTGIAGSLEYQKLALTRYPA